jgi:hypothetical protein
MLRNCIKAELVEDPIAPGKLHAPLIPASSADNGSGSHSLQGRSLNASEAV